MNPLRKRMFLAVAAFGFSIQVITYLLWAEPAMPKTVKPFLPHLDFVCIGSWNGLSPRHQTNLVAVLSQHFAAVYPKVPDEAWVTNAAGKRVGVGIGTRRGCTFNWHILSRGPFWFKADYSDYIAPEAASGRKATFLWIFGKWFRVWTSDTWIS